MEIAVQRQAVSAGQAYNRGLTDTRAEVLVFVHQDVFLPAGWLACLRTALAHLAAQDPLWGVLGIYGVTADGQSRGWTYSTGLGRELGGPFAAPEPVRTLDELLLVIRRDSGLSFDESLPGFHLYGTDVCLAAEQRGLRNYVIPAFALHNSNGLHTLPWAFWRACGHVQRTRRACLPVQTPCVYLPSSRLGLMGRMLGSRLRGWHRARRVGRRVADPAALYQQLVRAGQITAGTSSGDGG
jgi:hypothetical protein